MFPPFPLPYIAAFLLCLGISPIYSPFKFSSSTVVPWAETAGRLHIVCTGPASWNSLTIQSGEQGALKRMNRRGGWGVAGARHWVVCVYFGNAGPVDLQQRNWPIGFLTKADTRTKTERKEIIIIYIKNELISYSISVSQEAKSQLHPTSLRNLLYTVKNS